MLATCPLKNNLTFRKIGRNYGLLWEGDMYQKNIFLKKGFWQNWNSFLDILASFQDIRLAKFQRMRFSYVIPGTYVLLSILEYIIPPQMTSFMPKISFFRSFSTFPFSLHFTGFYQISVITFKYSHLSWTFSNCYPDFFFVKKNFLDISFCSLLDIENFIFGHCAFLVVIKVVHLSLSWYS